MPNPAATTAAQVDDDTLAPDDELDAPSAPASVAASPADVKASPEYRALQRRLRTESRERGRLEQQLGTERERAAAAEADRAAEQEAQIREVLGDDGVDAWNEIADLSSSDPVAAARKLRDFAAQRAQSSPPAQSQPQAGVPPNGGQPVSQNTPPPPPSSGVGAGVPLGAQGNDNSWGAIRADAQARFDAVVERNQNPATRNRVTMRDRQAGIMAYLEGSYAGAMEERAARSR